LFRGPLTDETQPAGQADALTFGLVHWPRPNK
jgi:hypothetical protein